MKVKFIVVAMAAAFAVSAVTAAGAQAEAIGPFWRTNCHHVSSADKGLGGYVDEGCKTLGGSGEWDTRLLGGETSPVTETGTKSYVFHMGAVMTITCAKQSLEKGLLSGSTGANPGTIAAGNLIFESCLIEGAGQCSVQGGRITFERPEYQLGYATINEAKHRVGRLLLLLKPQKGNVLGRLKLAGESCTYVSESPISGSVAAEVWSAGAPVEVGVEPALAKTVEVNYPATRISTVWTESNGVLKEVKPQLEDTLIGGAPRLEGRGAFEQASQVAFGAVTR